MTRPSFLDELKRRRVFRVAGVYVVAAFALVEAADAIFPRLQLPEWTVTFVVALALLGFPVAVALAWAFDVTPEGVKRTRPRTRGGAAHAPHRAAASGARTTGARGEGLPPWAVLAGGIGVGALAVIAYLLLRGGAPFAAGNAHAPTPIRSIAVLPFRNMSADPEQEFFGEGVSEEILNALAQVPSLRVAARTSSFSFKNKDTGIGEIAAQLGVEAVLEGSVRRSGDILRITAQLIQASDGFHLWSQTYERDATDVFAIQDEIAREVARAVVGEAAARATAASEGRSTQNLEAYTLYLRGRQAWNERTAGALQRADRLFRDAIALDPGYALGWAGLADALFIEGNFGMLEPDVAYPGAQEAARRALAIDARLAEAHATLGGLVVWNTWNWADGERSFRTAIELNPGYAWTWYWYSALLDVLGRFDEGQRAVLRALELDPLAPQIGAGVADHFVRSGKLDRALDAATRLTDLHPDWPGAWDRLAVSMMAAGRLEEADRADQRALALRRSRSEQSIQFGDARNPFLLIRRGEEAQVRTWLAGATPETTRSVRLSATAAVYAELGEAAQAERWLDAALARRDPYVASLATIPERAALRRLQRAQQILRELRLEWAIGR